MSFFQYSLEGDGQQRRDVVHVRDVVAANIAAYQSRVRREVFNVGSGECFLRQETGKHDLSPPYPYPETQRRFSVADISKIKAALGWSAQISFAEA